MEVARNPAKIPNLYLISGDINPDALRWYRHVHGLTQMQFASLLGVGLRTYEGWEGGETNPRERYVAALDMFVRATARIMAQHNGIIPPQERLVRALVQTAPGTWEVRESGHEMVKEVLARQSEIVEELEEEVTRLRRRNHELSTDLARLQREKRRMKTNGTA